MADPSRLDALRRRVLADPASIAFAALAEEYRRAGRFDDAIDTARAGLTRHPTYASARVTLGRALFEAGDVEDARGELERALTTAPENLAAIRALAELHHHTGDLARARDLAKRGAALAPQDRELRHLLESLESDVRRAGLSVIPFEPAARAHARQREDADQAAEEAVVSAPAPVAVAASMPAWPAVAEIGSAEPADRLVPPPSLAGTALLDSPGAPSLDAHAPLLPTSPATLPEPIEDVEGGVEPASAPPSIEGSSAAAAELAPTVDAEAAARDLAGAPLPSSPADLPTAMAAQSVIEVAPPATADTQVTVEPVLAPDDELSLSPGAPPLDAFDLDLLEPAAALPVPAVTSLSALAPVQDLPAGTCEPVDDGPAGLAALEQWLDEIVEARRRRDALAQFSE